MKLQDVESMNPMIQGSLIVMSIPLIGWTDYAVGNTYSLFLLYIFPIFAASWIRGRAVGFTIALISAISWVYVDYVLNTLPSNWVILLFAMLSRVFMFGIMAALFSSYKTLYDQLKLQAHYDEKTGALNYRAFLEFAQREIYRAKRDNSNLVLAYFDMDKFKAVNDHYGHSEGDRVLIAFSGIVQNSIRKTDLFARIGGDEFLVMFVDSEPVHAIDALDRIREAFRQEMDIRNLPVTVSIGVTTGFPPEKPLEAIIHEADQMMYEAKKNGRNKLAISTGEFK